MSAKNSNSKTENKNIPAPKRGGGRFVKGQSGNPSGRPKGSKNKTTEIKLAIENSLVERVEGEALNVLNKTIELAKAGDTTCIKILMDRLWPLDNRDKSGGTKDSSTVNIVISGLEASIDTTKIIEGDREDA